MTNFAIVGMGFIADKHISAIQNTKDAQLFAICDTNPERLTIEDPAVKKYTDLEAMLEENPEIDVVNICVPSGLHAKLTKVVAKYKKHIITEKPMALTSSDAEEMITVAREQDIKLAIVHPNRFRPAIIELKKLMDRNGLGKISHSNITVRWNRNQAYYDQAPWRGTKAFDGGVLMNQAIHSLDLLIWLLGPVKSVQGHVATRLRNIESEDVAMGIVEFHDGSLSVIESATTIYPENLEESIAIFGEKGSVKISGKNALYIETWNVDGVSKDEVDSLKASIEAEPWGRKGHDCIIEDMVEALKTDRNPAIDGNAGLSPVKLIEAIIDSSETGKRINF